MERIFELQGHRGARGLFAENTSEGFKATLALGVDSIELDVAVTADDVAVVVHDPVLNPDLTRDPNGWLDGVGPLVRDLSLAELRHYDVGRARPGSRVAQTYDRQRGFDGARIPRLEDVLRDSTGSGVLFDVELKTDPRQPGRTVAPERMAELVLAAAIAADARDRLVVRSFDWRGLRLLRRIAPDQPLAWLTERANADTLATVMAEIEAMPRPTRASLPTWAPQAHTLQQAEIRAAQAAGLRVAPWTVNDATDMARLIGWGVDGICTDYPDIARAVMTQAGMGVPKGWGKFTFLSV